MYRPPEWNGQWVRLSSSRPASTYSPNEGWMRLMRKDEQEIYEAGADAMLEGLRKDVSAGHTDGTTKEYTVINFDEVAGTFAFIPDEQVKKDE